MTEELNLYTTEDEQMTKEPAMTDRPTPLTDALLLEVNEGRRYINDGPVADLAHQLERQSARRDALLREAMSYLPHFTEFLKRIEQELGETS